MTATARRLWCATGWMLVAFLVLTLAGAALQPQLTLGASASEASKALVTSSLGTSLTGGFIELLATLVFVAAALLLTQLLGTEGVTSRWLSSCAAGSAVTYAAVTIGVGFAAGAAALYDGHHGAPLATVTAINDVRDIAYALSSAVVGAFTLAVAGAGLVTRLLPRWLVYTGFVVGVICIAGVPLARAGEPQILLWFAWLLATGVVALRHARRGDTALARTALATS